MINSFNIFGFTIHFYSLFILLGASLAYFIITKEAKKLKIDSDFISNTIIYGLLVGIIGARIYYVLFNLKYYMEYPEEILQIWHGGLAIHGGIIAAGIFVYFYSRKYKENYIRLLDVILPGVILAQAIGRWGNFFNQEAYGSTVSKDLLQKLLIPNFIIKGMFINGHYYLPMFYIESIVCILGFIIMLIIRKKNIKIGLISGFYFIWYGLFRFIIEYFRTDSLMLDNIKIAMLVSVLCIIFGIILIVTKNKKYKE